MEQNVLVTKMIGIVVAVIVAAVVLVPICNSLTEGDGGSDGGSGGEDQAQTGNPGDYVMLNDMREMYADIGVSTEITGFKEYVRSATPTLSEPIHITLNDLYEYSSLFTRTEIDSRTAVMDIFVLDDNDTLNMGMINLTIEGNSYDPYVKVFIGTDGAVGETLDNITDFDITVETDYSYTLYYHYHTNLVDEDIRLEGVASYVRMFSDEDNVWTIPFVYTNYFDTPYMKVTDGSYLSVRYDVYGDTGSYSIQSIRLTSQMLEQGEIPLSGKVVHDGIEYTLQATYTDITATSESGIYEIVYGAEPEVTVLSPSEVSEDLEFYISVDLVSSMNANPSAGSSGGDSSGVSDLGVTGTIIGIIPVFVILAILMGAAGLFYQNRKTI